MKAQKRNDGREVVTPTLAEAWLKTMVTNRPASDSLVYELATSMQDGRWILNGETVKFDKEGRLFDGQHRLLACMISGKSFETYVIRGIEDARAFSTVDVGKLRTHGDIFAMGGFSDYSVASSTALFLYFYKNKMLTLKGPRRPPRKVNALTEQLRAKLKRVDHVRQRTDVDKEALIAFATPIKDGIVEAIRALKHQKTRKLLPPSLLAPLFYLFAEKNKFEAQQFADRLVEGAGLGITDPIHVLREKLIANQAMRARVGHRLNRWVIAALVIKAWNKVRAGEKIHSLRVIEGEDFPSVK